MHRPPEAFQTPFIEGNILRYICSERKIKFQLIHSLNLFYLSLQLKQVPDASSLFLYQH